MKNEIVKIDAIELQGIEKSRAEQIKKTFEPMVEMIAEFENSYNKLIYDAKTDVTQELTLRAKRLRIDISKVRIETGKLKDKQKEYIKLEDKAIMGVHNIIVWAVKEKEDKLKEIEIYFEIQEKKRLSTLQKERAEQLEPFLEDAHERELSRMENDVWDAYFSTKKKEYNDRIKAEKEAEKERIAKEKAELEERKRIALENERLKKEAEKREKAERIMKEKAEKEKKKIEEKARKEKAELQAKLEAEREEKAKLEREEKAKREKLERELKAKKDAELKAKQDAEILLQKELNKGDIEKVKDLINDLEILKTKYVFKSKKNNKMYNDVYILLDKIINHIK